LILGQLRSRGIDDRPEPELPASLVPVRMSRPIKFNEIQWHHYSAIVEGSAKGSAKSGEIRSTQGKWRDKASSVRMIFPSPTITLGK
jgi:hypothetical protein